MPEITSVESQKKQKNRFNIYIDGKFAFGADENVVAKFRIHAGLKLSATQVTNLVKESDQAKLMDQTLNFLSYRPRSEKEIRDYLTKRISKKEKVSWHQASESPLINNILVKFKRYKYINDSDFASWWLESRSKSNPKGILAVKYELIKKGIDRDIIETSLAKIPNQLKIAKIAIEKKMKSWKNHKKYELKKKIYAYLAARGFEADTIKEAFAHFDKKR
ncbi:hypothetical protein A3F02_02515 [Candidatus Curtissbacteria bacterium RIFCSPHIGHO2_12_FULL_38_9b]|uniref:Regulatory protein RecX n=1 Tax=Candidatus Curtissbacteria bacterium RIFCSPHIGHO2_12_FULL_38_9b TaxID=1797720 RepID=A0A1F5GUK9_9BACT|nr:MAG: hypothetical protein A3F02_02515 [Candidatus Curtissbacteria bacterium RIFCSPHIGHO2_12_FULL_38_9b]